VHSRPMHLVRPSLKSQTMKLNLGCASQVVDGWINVDYAFGARLAKVPLFQTLNRRLRIFDLDWDQRIQIHDLTKPFPWADGSVDVVYSSHALEYLSREDGRKFIAECCRVLRRDGILRLVQHDLRHIVLEYLEGRIRADDFAERLGVLYGSNKNALKDRLAPLMQFPLKCIYDSSRLSEILGKAGFDVASKAPFESDIDDIRKVELQGRTEHAIIVEGRKR
jgi:SAM-dependent methyltransferase